MMMMMMMMTVMVIYSSLGSWCTRILVEFLRSDALHCVCAFRSEAVNGGVGESRVRTQNCVQLAQ
jgi:hypothetical protein